MCRNWAVCSRTLQNLLNSRPLCAKGTRDNIYDERYIVVQFFCSAECGIVAQQELILNRIHWLDCNNKFILKYYEICAQKSSFGRTKGFGWRNTVQCTMCTSFCTWYKTFNLFYSVGYHKSKTIGNDTSHCAKFSYRCFAFYCCTAEFMLMSFLNSARAHPATISPLPTCT